MPTILDTNQFNVEITASGKKAYEAYTAGWDNKGEHVMIGAPSLERLQRAYKKLTGQELITSGAQHVWIVKATKEDADAPRVKPVPQTWPCSVAGCANLAAFIIEREMFCAEHRPQK